MSRITSATAASAFLVVLAHAQNAPSVYRAPRAISDLLGVESAVAQELLLPPARPGDFSLRLRFGGVLHTMRLRPYEIRSPNYRLLVDDGVEIRQAETTPSITYRGELLGEPNSAVAATYADGKLRANMLSGGKTWALQPLSDVQPGLLPGTYVVYEHAELQELPFGCGVTEKAPPVPGTNAAAAAEDAVLRVADLAIDADEPYYQHHGGSVVAAQNEILGIINAVDLIYNRDVDIEHRISTILVRTVPTYTSGGTDLLAEFRNRWNTFHNDIDRDVAHLFSGRNHPGSVIGIAYVSAVCQRSRAYGVSWTLWDVNNLQKRVGLTAHELGHNWGASHCNGSPTCDIMCSSISGCGPNESFGVNARSEIDAYRDSTFCLDADPIPLQAPTVSGISPPAVTTFASDPVSIIGDNLDMATSVTVGGVPAEFSIVGKNLLNLTPPSVDIAIQEVVVSNSLGSDSTNLEILGIHPGILEAPETAVPGVPTTYRVHTDRDWHGLLAVSLSAAPSILSGIVSLDLGNDFSQIVAIPLVGDARGLAEVVLTIPVGFPYFVRTYWQAVMFEDPGSLTFPLETSERVLVITWFF